MDKDLENKEILSVKDLGMNDIIPNIIDDVIVKTSDNKPEIHLPRDMSGDRYRRWMNGKGGVFFRDVKNFLKDKTHGRYALVTYDDTRVIIRLIEDEESESFSVLADGKIKDRQYINMRFLSDTDKLTTTTRIIKHEDPIELFIEPKIESENESTNVPLFGDS